MTFIYKVYRDYTSFIQVPLPLIFTSGLPLSINIYFILRQFESIFSAEDEEDYNFKIFQQMELKRKSHAHLVPHF